METSTLILVIVGLNIVLFGVALGAFRLFRSDPNPTVSDPLGVPRVARVSGIVGTLSDGSGSEVTRHAVATVASSAAGGSSTGAGASHAAAASPSTLSSRNAAGAVVADIDLPGLFAIDTGAGRPVAAAVPSND